MDTKKELATQIHQFANTSQQLGAVIEKLLAFAEAAGASPATIESFRQKIWLALEEQNNIMNEVLKIANG